jgi:formylglycine-generating enzyme required for sulfatase activity
VPTRAQPDGYATIDGGHFESALPLPRGATGLVVPPYQLQRQLVTNAEFFAFTEREAAWRRGAAPEVFVDPGYLSHWTSARELGAGADPRQPVTRVSWFAALAYCESIGARLPT